MQKVRNLLAFDLGASNGRAILGQFDGEKITMKELHRFENNYIEMNGVFYWDTPYLYNQLKQGLTAFKQGGYGDLMLSASIPGAWTTVCLIRTVTWPVFPVPTALVFRQISTRCRRRSPQMCSLSAAASIPV